MKIFNFITQLFSSGKIDINKAMNEIDNQESTLKETLANLLFQQAKLKQKRSDELMKLEDIAIDLDQAIYENDEQLSLYLLEQTDVLKADVAFIDEELHSLADSICGLTESRSKLALNKNRYKNQLISQTHKLESLKSKKKINEQIQSVSNFQMDAHTPLDELKLQVLKAQAQLDAQGEKSNPFEEKREENKKFRQTQKYKAQFEKLKASRGALV